MDAILAQFQVLTRNQIQENQNTSKDPDTEASRSRNKDKDGSNTNDNEENVGFHLNTNTNTTSNTSKDIDKVLEDTQIKLDALAHRDTLQKVGIICPYPLEWDLRPCPDKF